MVKAHQEQKDVLGKAATRPLLCNYPVCLNKHVSKKPPHSNWFIWEYVNRSHISKFSETVNSIKLKRRASFSLKNAEFVLGFIVCKSKLYKWISGNTISMAVLVSGIRTVAQAKTETSFDLPELIAIKTNFTAFYNEKYNVG